MKKGLRYKELNKKIKFYRDMSVWFDKNKEISNMF